MGILDSGIDYFHGDFRHEDGTSRILFLNDQVTGDVYTKEEIDEALGTGSREAARALVPSADPGGHGTAVAGICLLYTSTTEGAADTESMLYGWTEQGSNWVYYDGKGNTVKGWIKAEGGDGRGNEVWFYTDPETGLMRCV